MRIPILAALTAVLAACSGSSNGRSSALVHAKPMRVFRIGALAEDGPGGIFNVARPDGRALTRWYRTTAVADGRTQVG